MTNATTTTAPVATAAAFEPVTISVDDGPVTPEASGHSTGWRASLILNPETRNVYLFTSIGSGTPIDVWHNRALSFSVDACASGEHVRELLEGDDMQEALATIIDSYEGDTWDGHNNVGSWSGEADDEIQQVTTALESVTTYSNASDWLSPAWSESRNDVADALAEADTEEEREAALDALAEGWAAAGESDGVLVDKDDLRRCIDQMAEEVAADGDDDFEPTHKVIFTRVDGQRSTYILAFMPSDDDDRSGPAYTRREWADCEGADWSVEDGEFRFQGQVTPGGEPGEIEVIKL